MYQTNSDVHPVAVKDGSSARGLGDNDFQSLPGDCFVFPSIFHEVFGQSSIAFFIHSGKSLTHPGLFLFGGITLVDFASNEITDGICVKSYSYDAQNSGKTAVITDEVDSLSSDRKRIVIVAMIGWMYRYQTMFAQIEHVIQNVLACWIPKAFLTNEIGCHVINVHWLAEMLKFFEFLKNFVLKLAIYLHCIKSHSAVDITQYELYDYPQASDISSAHGVDSPYIPKAQQRPHIRLGAFFVLSVFTLWRAALGGLRACRLYLWDRSVNPAQFATLSCLTASGGDFYPKGVLS
ncbi:hypothetical protein R84981_000961 [Carnimonas sp. R-84981]